MLCGIRDVALVRGDTEDLKNRLLKAGHEKEMKWTRFLKVSEEMKVSFVIRYSNPFEADQTDYALYDMELIRIPKSDSKKIVAEPKGRLMLTVDPDTILTYADIFK